MPGNAKSSKYGIVYWYEPNGVLTRQIGEDTGRERGPAALVLLKNMTTHQSLAIYPSELTVIHGLSGVKLFLFPAQRLRLDVHWE